jgi:hypothetical protein
MIGTTFQDATLTTHEAINNAPQVFVVETRGWGWTWSGGLEIWTSSWLAIYGEAGFGTLKGTSTTGGEVLFDDRLRHDGGGRVKIGCGRRPHCVEAVGRRSLMSKTSVASGVKGDHIEPARTRATADDETPQAADFHPAIP